MYWRIGILNKFFHVFKAEQVDSNFDLLVFDDEYEVFMPLTEFYHYQINRMSSSSVITYVTVLETFFYWLKYNGNYQNNKIHWFDHPDAVQESVRLYVINQLNCKIRDKDAYENIMVTKKSAKTVQIFLSAIRGFYAVMIRLRQYDHSNPLVNIELNQYQQQNYISMRNNKPRVSPLAGTEEPIPTRRLTDSYFKLINNEWSPEIIDDRNLPYQLFNAGEQVNWSLRDEIIIRFLFETGARISEILELTMGDYRSRKNIHELSAMNKGSFHKRIKFVRISSDTLKLLMRYINTERNKYAAVPSKFIDLQESEYLFINKYGRKYSYNAFYQNWSKITKQAQIKLNPHKARHWFVTSMLRDIYESSKTAADIEIRKQQLVQYMKWRDSDTIQVYEHYNDEQKFRELHENIQYNFRQREREYVKRKRKSNTKSVSKADNNKRNIKEDTWLTEFYDGMGD